MLMMHVASPLATENYAVACEAGALTKAGVLRVSRICSHNVPAGNRPVMHYVYLLQSQSHVNQRYIGLTVISRHDWRNTMKAASSIRPSFGLGPYERISPSRRVPKPRILSTT